MNPKSIEQIRKELDQGGVFDINSIDDDKLSYDRDNIEQERDQEEDDDGRYR